MKITPPEYFMVFLIAIAVIFFTSLHLPFTFSGKLFFKDILALTTLFGFEIAFIPIFILLIKSILHQIAFLLLCMQKEKSQLSVTFLNQGLRAEWIAILKGLQFIRDWLPLFVFIVIYWASGTLTVKIHPHQSYDMLLESLDLKLFGANYSVLAERFYTPLLTAFMDFSYFMHIVIVPLLLTLFYYKKEFSLFHRSMMFLIIVCSLGAVGYLLVPAYGPYIYLQNLFKTNLVRNPFFPFFIDLTKAPMDAFPSLHVGISSGFLIYLYRYDKGLFLLLLPLILGNWISTIYLRYHYMVDLLAGFLVAALSILITELSFHHWEKKWQSGF